MTNSHNDSLNIPVASKIYGFYKIYYKYLKCFPKKERYTLGEKIENNTLDLFTETFYANQLPDSLKEDCLIRLNSKTQTLKMLCRLVFDLKILSFKQYLVLQSYLQEIGKMYGGWIKFVRSQR